MEMVLHKYYFSYYINLHWFISSNRRCLLVDFCEIGTSHYLRVIENKHKTIKKQKGE